MSVEAGKMREKAPFCFSTHREITGSSRDRDFYSFLVRMEDELKEELRCQKGIEEEQDKLCLFQKNASIHSTLIKK